MGDPTESNSETLAGRLLYRMKTSIFAPKVAKNQLSVGLIGGDIPVYPPLAFLLLNAGGFLGWSLTGNRKSFVRPPALASSSSLRTGLGVGLSICCIRLAGACRRELKKADTSSAFQPVVKVCDTGPYAYGRNFMYVALLGMNLVGSVAFDTAWLFYSALGLGTYLNFVVIPAEERLLKRVFGHAYEDYCERVPRWFWVF